VEKNTIAISNIAEILYYLLVDEIYYVIEDAHVVIGFSRRDRFRKRTGKKYAYITVCMINLFLYMFEVCDEKIK